MRHVVKGTSPVGNETPRIAKAARRNAGQTTPGSDRALPAVYGLPPNLNPTRPSVNDTKPVLRGDREGPEGSTDRLVVACG